MLKFKPAHAIVIAAVLAMAGAAQAQTTAAAPQTATKTASPSTAISPEKQKLIDRVLALWHVENVGVIMLQRPVMESIKQSRSLMQGRVSAEAQEAAMKDIGQDAKKFLDELIPVVQGSAKKLIPSTVEPILADNFSEDELRQIIAILESPVKAKFEKLATEMERSLGEKIAADEGSTINPKMTELTQQIGNRVRVVLTP